MSFIKRGYETLVLKRLGEYPAVALVGPRQSGKTTLSKQFNGIYFDLEQAGDRTKLEIEWENIIKTEKLIILDEAQAFPEIFARLRGQIDKKRSRTKQFLLLGSVSPSLMRNVSESLAGRLAICELAPFNIFELKKDKLNLHWLKGGYPDGGILGKKGYPHWQNNYLELISQRDLPNWGLPSKPKETERLFKMIALSHDQVANTSQLGKSLGISYHTVNSYLDYLQMAYLIRILPPFYRNIKKRLIKSPKLFWRDSGLLHSLYKINSYDQLLVQPWVGQSWEGYVIEQIFSYLTMKGFDFEATFFRTSDGHEIDLVIEISGKLLAFEIKLSTSVDINDLRKLNKTADLIKADWRILVSRTEKSAGSSDTFSTNLEGLRGILDKLK